MTDQRLSVETRRIVPRGLVPAVEALDKRLEDAHLKFGKATEVFCYGWLHSGDQRAEIEKNEVVMQQLRALVGPIATEICDQHLEMGTAPAFFQAMIELYMAGVTARAIEAFQDLLKIGSHHEKKLKRPYIRWAQDLIMELAGAYENKVRSWVRAVCDLPDSDSFLSFDDPDIFLLGKTWCVPMLVVMHPAGEMAFDEALAWQRSNRETTKFLLNSYAENFTNQLKMQIDRIVDHKTVEAAKGPEPFPKNDANVAVLAPRASNSVPAAGAKPSVSKAFNALEKDKRDKKIYSKFKEIEKNNSDESLNWCCKRVVDEGFAGRLGFESVRKIVRIRKNLGKNKFPKQF